MRYSECRKGVVCGLGGVSPHQNRQKRQNRQNRQWSCLLSLRVGRAPKPSNPSKPPKLPKATHPLDHSPLGIWRHDHSAEQESRACLLLWAGQEDNTSCASGVFLAIFWPKSFTSRDGCVLLTTHDIDEQEMPNSNKHSSKNREAHVALQ